MGGIKGYKSIIMHPSFFSCNIAISFKFVFSYLGVGTILAKAKFKKRSVANVFAILNILITLPLSNYPNLHKFQSIPKYEWQ
mgnify:CR=1 FL=1